MHNLKSLLALGLFFLGSYGYSTVAFASQIDPKLLEKATSGDVCAQTQAGSVLLRAQGKYLEHLTTAKEMEIFKSRFDPAIQKKSPKVEELKQGLLNVTEAASWFEKASKGVCTDDKCKRCVIEARAALIKLYEIGKGVEQSDVKAFELYSMPSPFSKTGSAEDLFHPYHRQLFQAYYEGKGTDKNLEKAYYHLQAMRGCKETTKKAVCEELLKALPAEKVAEIDASITEQAQAGLKAAQERMLDIQQNPDKFMASMMSGFDPKASEETKKLGVRLYKEISGFTYSIEGIKKLIALGAPVNIGSLEGTLMTLAADKGRVDILEVLIAAGADINAANMKGFTPLIWAIRKHQKDAALYLIKAGADVNLPNSKMNYSPLMHALQMQGPEIAKALIKAGADIHYERTNDYGSEDALSVALKHGENELAQLLIKSGAQIKPYHKAWYHESCDQETLKCDDGTVLTKSPPSCHLGTCARPETIREQKQANLQAPQEYKPVAGTYSEIDIATGYNLIQQLGKASQAEKDKIIKEVMDNPGNYDPRVLRAVCGQLFLQIRDEEGIFWCLAAKLRTQYDAIICQNKTSERNRFSRSITDQELDRYTKGNKDKVLALLPKIVQWDNETPHNYDPRWVTVGGGWPPQNPNEPLPKNLCTEEGRRAEFKAPIQENFVHSLERDLTRNLFANNLNKSKDNSLLIKQAEQGDLYAMYMLKKPQDVNDLLKKAEAGDPAAQVLLTFSESQYQRGLKSREDRAADSLKWLSLAVKQDYAPAKVQLGRLYLDGSHEFGKIIKPIPEEGLRLLKEAAAQGQGSVFITLGNFYKRQDNLVEAYAWFSVAIEQGVYIGAEQSRLYVDASLHGEQVTKARALAQEYINKYPKKDAPKDAAIDKE